MQQPLYLEEAGVKPNTGDPSSVNDLTDALS